MKLHKVLVTGVVETLFEIFINKVYADHAIQLLFKKNRKWGARDRSFVAETVYDSTRYYRKICEEIGFKPQTYDEWWLFTASFLLAKNYSLPEWEEFYLLRKLPKNKQYYSRAVIESIPDWLDLKGVESLGEDCWNITLSKLNEQAHMYIRRNPVKVPSEKLEEALKEDAIAFRKITEDIYILERPNIFGTKSFSKGFFEVQDISSQQVAPFMELVPGLKVIDACAGAGGKSLHIASLMENKGTLISMDTEGWKLEELKKRARRNGLFNIQTQTIENNKVIKRNINSADRVLLDVPCSGLGVLRRNPDAKWKMTPERVNALIDIQKKILEDYSKMVKKEGLLIYATCSILKEENQNQIKNFLSRHPEFQLLEDKTILPQELDGDGFYIAKLRRLD